MHRAHFNGSEVYVVIKKAGDLPVYTVQPEGKDGPLRTLHRDLLLPCGFLQEEDRTESVRQKKPYKPRTRANPGSGESESEFQNSESEDDFASYVPRYLPSIESKILSNHRPEDQSKTGVTSEVSPEIRTAIVQTSGFLPQRSHKGTYLTYMMMKMDVCVMNLRKGDCS